MKEKGHNNHGQDELDLRLQGLPQEKRREDRRKEDRRKEDRRKEDRQREKSADRKSRPARQPKQTEQLRDLDQELKSLHKREARRDKDRRARRDQIRKEREEARLKKKTDKELVRVTYLFVTLFLVMIGYLVYFNVVKSKDIINSPYNVRQDLLAKRVVRGKILDNAGNVLAKTVVNEDGSESRVYPYGETYAHVVGYADKGKAGLELAQNFNMLTSNAFFLEKIVKEMQDEKNIGDNIVTTLDTRLQTAAEDALGNNKGAVVVTEPSTGKILAMVSKPGFDPNRVKENWDQLNSSSDSVLYNRATMGQYAPGSTFKIVSTLEYLRENEDPDSFSHDCQGEISEGGTTIHCFNNAVHGQENLKDAVANSCNTAFSSIGLSLDKAKWKSTADELLFNSKLPCPLPYKSSKFELEKNSDSGKIMMTAIGQGDTLVSPYHMALITSAIANGGVLMKPYLVDEITNYTGQRVKKYMPEKYGELMTSQEAAKLSEYMEAVVEYGTGKSLSGESYTVAGKTGTAEVSVDKKLVHSWFIGYSNVDNPDIAVSVIVENADTNRITGKGVAKKIFNAYYY